ncbi:MAG: GGDEF domain-containing protein [Treponema sp.]|nr:GGDEF domain-containing protein [Treponema sp.]
MITENQLKRWISYISFIFSMVANFIGLIASWGTASMVGTAIFFTLHVLAFIVFCVWKKMQDIYLRYVLILFMMTLFPYILWCSPKAQQATLYVFIIPSFYAVSMRKKRDIILPLINGLIMAVIIYLKINILYAIVFLTVFSFSILMLSLFSTTLFDNYAELNKAYGIITDIARKDRLTGIYNRFGLEDAVKERQQEPCYAIMMDIDYFKQVNDRYGHEAGDDVLCMLGTLLQKLSAKDFVVSRRGGEEFLLYSFKNYEETMKIVRQFYAEVDRQVIVQGEHIHVSTGVSSQGCISEALIADADKKLYYSKETGRNRITTVLP